MVSTFGVEGDAVSGGYVARCGGSGVEVGVVPVAGRRRSSSSSSRRSRSRSQSRRRRRRRRRSRR